MRYRDKPYRAHRKRWAKVRVLTFNRAGWKCQNCGRRGALECDHIRPLWKDGDPWALEGLQALCRGCHIRKTRAEEIERRARPETPWDRAVSGLVANR